MGVTQSGSVGERIKLADQPDFELGGMRVRPSERAVEFRGDRRKLQPRVMQVLVALSRARPAVVSRDALMEQCWDGRIVGDDAVNRVILSLRHLAQEFTPPQFAIETVPRVGHRLLECGAQFADPQAAPGTRSARGSAVITAGIALLAGAVIILQAADWSSLSERQATSILVVAADKASRELAEDLTIKLGSLPQTNDSGMRLVDFSQRGPQSADLLLEVRRSMSRRPAAASLVLVNSKNQGVLWSKEFDASSANLADLNQQMAYSAAKVLGCTAEGFASEKPLSEQILKIYLNACASMADATNDGRDTVRLLERVVQSSPRFVAGWGKLLLAEIGVAADPTLPEGKAMMPALRRHIAAARKVEPHLAEAYLAQAILMPERDFVARGRLLDAAVARNPQHAELRSQRAMFLQSVGRVSDALQDAEKAVKLDPLSPSTRDNYIGSLGSSGRTEAALRHLQAAERLWPGATSLVEARYRHNLRWGDAREALRFVQLQEGRRRTPKIHEPFLQARIDPSSNNIGEALRHGRSILHRVPSSITNYAQLLAEFDLNDELFEILINWDRMDIVSYVTDVLFRPAFADFHREPRFMRVADHLGLVNYWRTTGEWPDFCSDADTPYDCQAEAVRLQNKNRRSSDPPGR